ncbi:unnamed protein product [Dovyalis caffra]|uniref:Uncharacterized protein n=1 Tax=Dovyalis caffra TaxID=77055 RepID=A0AAV1QSM0_9ROSI|nr:unnamed protein product [Dovyalis caffra]
MKGSCAIYKRSKSLAKTHKVGSDRKPKATELITLGKSSCTCTGSRERGSILILLKCRDNFMWAGPTMLGAHATSGFALGPTEKSLKDPPEFP